MSTHVIQRQRDPVRTRAHIMSVAFDEVHRFGFQGVSVDRLVEKTRLTKGAFFHHFPTKKSLGYALVDEVLREMILERWIRPLARARDPVRALLTRFRALLDGWSSAQLSRGCPLNNLTQEMSGIDPVFRKKLQAVMELWISETEVQLRRARRTGYLKPAVRTRALAEFIVTVQEGAFAMAKTMNDPRIATSIYRSLREHLGSLAPSPEFKEKADVVRKR